MSIPCRKRRQSELHGSLHRKQRTEPAQDPSCSSLCPKPRTTRQIKKNIRELLAPRNPQSIRKIRNNSPSIEELRLDVPYRAIFRSGLRALFTAQDRERQKNCRFYAVSYRAVLSGNGTGISDSALNGKRYRGGYPRNKRSHSA